MEPVSTFDGLSCEQIFALLSEYLDADLPPDLCERLTAHMKGCAPCLEFVESLRQTIVLCRQFQAEQLPVPLADHVRTKLRRAYQGFAGSQT
jgi:anti-sigma factor RsiW